MIVEMKVSILIPILDNTAELCTSRRVHCPALVSSRCFGKPPEAHTAGGGTTRSGHWCLLPDFQLEARIGCRACEATAETLLSALGKVFSIRIVLVVRLVFAALFNAALDVTAAPEAASWFANAELREVRLAPISPPSRRLPMVAAVVVAVCGIVWYAYRRR